MHVPVIGNLDENFGVPWRRHITDGSSSPAFWRQVFGNTMHFGLINAVLVGALGASVPVEALGISGISPDEGMRRAQTVEELSMAM